MKPCLSPTRCSEAKRKMMNVVKNTKERLELQIGGQGVQQYSINYCITRDC